MPVAAAERLAGNVAVYPPPRALEVAQDRLTEKRFLNDAGISTARYFGVDNDNDLAAALDALGGSGVLKTRRLGYDGKGQRVFRSAAHGEAAGAYAAMGGVPLILEALVPFVREISVIAARARDGSVAAYDPVENVHRDGILHSSTVPAAISTETAAQARGRRLRPFSTRSTMSGSSASSSSCSPTVRLLPTKWRRGSTIRATGRRPPAPFRNSSSISARLPACRSAIPRRHSDCVMENLIGDDVSRAPALLAEPGLVLHLYGKAEARPGRKMGHFTRLKRRKHGASRPGG